MRRSHRRAHRALWPVLLVAVALLFTLALAWRAPAPAAPMGLVIQTGTPR